VGKEEEMVVSGYWSDVGSALVLFQIGLVSAISMSTLGLLMGMTWCPLVAAVLLLTSGS
jgi:hypothetical protein